MWGRVGIERPGVRIYICARFQKEEDRLMNVVKSFFLSSVFTSSSCSLPPTVAPNAFEHVAKYDGRDELFTQGNAVKG